MPETQSNFMGLDGFIWFVGVVEDRNDPDQLGRVRVRCLGFHTDNLTAFGINSFRILANWTASFSGASKISSS